MKLGKEVREAVEKAETIGWKFTGKVDGQGHPIMKHESGALHSVPATPGDWRSMKNALSTMERIAGQKIERAGKRRASHKKFEGSGFSIEDAKREQAEFHRHTDALPVEDLWFQRRELINEMLLLLKAPGDCTDQAATALWKIRGTERALKQLGQSVRDFDLMDLPLEGHVKEAAKQKLKPAAPKPNPKVAKNAERARTGKSRRKAKTDDFDGTLLLADTEPWNVDLLGKTYALYLSPSNRAMIEEFLTSLTDGAKVVPKTRKRKPLPPEQRAAQRVEKLRKAAVAAPRAPEGVDPKVIRAWLRENGFPDIAERGRFSAAHINAWNNRNKRARRLAKSA